MISVSYESRDRRPKSHRNAAPKIARKNGFWIWIWIRIFGYEKRIFGYEKRIFGYEKRIFGYGHIFVDMAVGGFAGLSNTLHARFLLIPRWLTTIDENGFWN